MLAVCISDTLQVRFYIVELKDFLSFCQHIEPLNRRETKLHAVHRQCLKAVEISVLKCDVVLTQSQFQ